MASEPFTEDDRAPLLNATNAIGTDGRTMTVSQRTGPDGRTLTLHADGYGDGAPIPASQRTVGPAQATNAPCSCKMPTTRRGAGDANCFVCGGRIG